MGKRLTNMEKKKIEQLTAELLNQFVEDTENEAGYVDIVALARHFGFEVGESKKLSVTENGFISVSKDKQELLIGVNYYRTWEEKRFIIAHELAHYFLHYKDSKLSEPVFLMHSEKIKGKNETENDADYFAACLLMPRDKFESAYKQAKNSYTHIEMIDYLGGIFRTPRESIERRINELSDV